MEKVISFTIPIKTVSEANNFDHWTGKRNRKIHQNFFIDAFFNKHVSDSDIVFPCKVKMIRVAPRKLDDDNLRMLFKNTRDRISEKLIPGLAKGRADGDERIAWDYGQEKGKPNYHAIRIEITFFNRTFPS